MLPEPSPPTPSANGEDSTTKAHYKAHSSASYENAFFYEKGAYMEHLAVLVQERLGLKNVSERRVLLDVGGGTGNFTVMITRDAPLVDAIVMDPFLLDDMMQPQNGPRFVKEPAESFKDPCTRENSWWREGYHQVLLKEVVHHISAHDRVSVFRGIRQGLQQQLDNKHPSLLIITRPQREIDYPLWDDAREVWAENQPSVDTFVSELEAAGFSEMSSTIEAYQCSVPLERWLGMIKARFWSTFANFSDAEIERGCQQIAQREGDRIDANGVIHFEDRLLFLTARIS
jgi:hypothetical protein